jgi:hypothetical protein
LTLVVWFYTLIAKSTLRCLGSRFFFFFFLVVIFHVDFGGLLLHPGG